MCVCSSSACLWLFVLTKLHNQTAMSNMHVPALTQVIAHAVLDSWGYEKFRKHTEAVSMFYRKKRDIFDAALHSTLDGLVEWTPPDSGLFFWYEQIARQASSH